MEIKNIDELIEELFIRKSITVKTIRNVFKMSDVRAATLFKMIKENGYLLSLNEEEKVLKKGKLEEIKTIIKEVLDDKTLGMDAYCFDENGELDKSKLDPCFVDALKIVIDEQKASVAFLQRKLQIGYSRAARIIDTMEELDFISNSSTIPRIVFITKEDFQQIFEKAS